MIDIHTHILPEVDDGARSWEMAVHMCHIAARDGITHMVATPHANDEFFYEREPLEALRAELQQRIGNILTVGLGCDFHFSFENLAELEEDPMRFTISGTRYLLVEMSDFGIPPAIDVKLQDLVASGIRPIITHPERNGLLQRKPERVLEWADYGCPVQVTASALTGRWGNKAKEVAHWLLLREGVHILATDCHNLEGRPPIMSGGKAALVKAYGVHRAEALTRDNPQAVIEGRDELPYFPPVRR